MPPHTVQKPHISDAGALSMQDYKLDLQVWNSAYNFEDVIRKVSPDDRRLNDPAYLVIQAPVQLIIKHFDHLIMSQLSNICTYHAISSKGLRKDIIKSRITSHTCSVSCNSLLYAFRLTTRLRPLKPWIQGQVQRMSEMTQASATSKAIPNTTGRSGRAIAASAGRLQTLAGPHDTVIAAASQTPSNISADQRAANNVRVGTVNTSAINVDSPTTWSGSRALRAALSKTSSDALHTLTRNTAPSPRETPDSNANSHPQQTRRRYSRGMVPSDCTQEQGGNESTLRHLDITPESVERSIILEWQKTMSLERFIKCVCAVCSTSAFPEAIKRVPSTDLDLTILRNDELPPQVIPITYDYLAYDRAILDPLGLEDTKHPKGIFACKICLKEMSRGVMPRFALANWLYYARDRLPDAVRKGFEAMSVFEKALICRVRTSSILCRFRGFTHEDASEEVFSARRRHIKGNIISTPLDVMQLNDILPPSPQSIADTLCAVMIASTPPTRATIEGLHPILVRKSRIKLLIEFLIENNPHYKQSESFRGFSSSHLDSLFSGTSDVGLPNAVGIGHLPVNQALDAVMEDYTGRLDEVEGLIIENVSYTLGDRSAFSYRQMSLHAMQHCKDGLPFLSSQRGTHPVPDINNPNWLSWAHPNADPFGIGGFHHPRRKRPISMEQQLRHLLSVNDPFFENDPQLTFDVYNIVRKGSVNTSLRFCVPYQTYASIIRDIVQIDKDKLLELKQIYRTDPNYQPRTDEERKIIRTMTSISPVAKKIPGSVAQKIQMRNEIRAIISQRGSPTLFVTLNPADYYNPIVTVLANRCTTKEEIDALEGWTIKQRTTSALRHPAACAQFFDYTIRKFIHVILRYGRKGQRGGIFGVCDSYYGTVETQGRGSLHCHMLIWLQGHLPPETLAKELKESEIYRARLIAWLDSIASSGFHGSKACFNDLPHYKRADIGMMERHPTTMIGPLINDAEPSTFKKEMNEYLDEILLRWNWHTHTGTCWKYLRSGEKGTAENCRFGLDGSTSPRTTIDTETGNIQLRRIHPRMTHFNPVTTFLMKCNTDLKFIGSGEEAKAFMYYVTDYITKAPLSMHAGLSALSYAIRQGEARGVLNQDGGGETDNRRAMTIAVNSMLGHQEISHPQVMSYVMGKGENYTNESFRPINWAEVLRYVERTLQGVSASNPLHGSAEQTMENVSVSVSVERGSINASNQLLDYIYRPELQPFGSMGLYTFMATTRKVHKPPTSTLLPSNIGRFTNDQHPQYHSHAIRLRREAAVPVLLGPRIPRRNGSDDERSRWARDMCILFKPWRCPTELPLNNSDWNTTLQHVMPFLSESDRRTVENMSLLAEAKQARDARPRRPKDAVSHHREPLNIAAVLDAAMQEETTESDQSVFSLLSSTDGDTTVMQDLVETEIPSRLKMLIGDEATYAFGAYLNAKETLTSDIEHANDPVDVTDGADGDEIQEQAAFMNRCRLRDSGDTEGAIDESGVTSVHAQPPTSVREDQPPKSGIETIRDAYSKSRQRRKHMYKAASALMKLRHINENAEQRRAFEIIASHAIDGGQQLRMYVGGRGGTGKSYLIETIVHLFEIFGRSQELRIGAPTGIAAALIGGNTLHSLFSIGTNNRSSDKESVSKRLANEWRDVRYLIVDETSMIGAAFMALMSAKLKMAKGDAFEESMQIFGGVNLIFLGDFYQLSPPKQPSLFAYRLVRDPSFLQTRDNNSLDAITGAYLWRSVDTVVLLKKNRRQKDDPVLAELLDRIRTSTCLDNRGRSVIFHGKSAVDHLRNREIGAVAADDPTALRAFEDAPVIVGSKVLRDTLNASLLVAHARRKGRSVHTYHSIDSIHRTRTKGNLTSRLWDLPSRIAGESLGRLPLFPGMRVMVTENVSVPYKVVNGKEGTVEDIKYSMDQSGRRYAEVVHVKIEGCVLKAPGLPRGIVPLFPTGTSIKYDIGHGQNMVKSFHRKQIPLVPAYSYTDYKSQGRTLTHAVLDLASSRGQGVYVMLSRVTNLKGLLILRWFPETKILQRMSGELRDELHRLERLDSQTEALHTGGFNVRRRSTTG